MALTNTEFVTGIIAAGVVVFLAACILVGVAIAWLVLDYREDRRYRPQHAETAVWPALLPPPQTPWDRPHPGWDVMPLTAGQMQVAVILAVVERVELMSRVPALQPSWIADAMRQCELAALGG